jgi:cytochrome c
MVVLACASAAPAASPPDFRVLVFTKTAGYRHDSIPAAIAAVEALGAQNDFAVDATEDADAFTGANLSRYAVVMFLLTTDDILDSDQQGAFQRYVEAGGGFVGVHSASDTEHDWPWYGGLVGAYFKSHPDIQPAVVDVVDRDTPSTIHLPAKWTRTDEWYNFETNPAGSVTVLATVDETSYEPGPDAMGNDHPIAWQHVYDGGRSWYTAMGHTTSSYSEPLFLSHLLGGILWAAGYDLPSFASVSVHVAGTHLTIVSTHPNCMQCVEALRVLGRTMQVSADGTRTPLTTPALRSGRWRYRLTLTDERMKAQVRTSGWVTVK